MPAVQYEQFVGPGSFPFRKMKTELNHAAQAFDMPGFVSESRPEQEQVRAISHRSERPLLFARYRHDKPNLGLLAPTPSADQVMVAVELRPLRAVNVFCDGRHMRKPASAPGALALYDLRKSWSADLRDPFDNLSVYLPHNSLRDFAAEDDSSFVELHFDIEHILYDDVMLHLMRAIVPVLERPHEVRAIYLDSLFLAIRDHIASTYGTFNRATAGNRQGLTPRQLQRALEYIETNLSEDVSLSELGEACTASTSSLIRGFKSSLGVSPHRWIMKRRIALAQRLMYAAGTPLSEIAVSCGFADQSHLARVFMRHVGTSPASWRRNVQR